MIMMRIILNLVIVISLFIAPFPLSLFLMLCGLLFIPYYWESVALLFCIELLYQDPFSTFMMSVLSPPIIALAVFFVVQHFRKFAQEKLFYF